MGAQRDGQEGALALPLWKCCKVFCALVVSAKRSVNELFCVISQPVVGFWGLSRDGTTQGFHSWTLLGDFSPQTLNLPTPRTNTAAPIFRVEKGRKKGVWKG